MQRLSLRRRPPARRPGGAAAQRGITLLESLVALVILAIAILGMLGAQLNTLADTQASVRRSQAVRLVEDLAERIKSNPNGFAGLALYESDWEASSSTDADCEASACDADTLAQWDLAQWRQSVEQTLPFGQANVFLSSDETDGRRRQLGVMLAWQLQERSLAIPDGTVAASGVSCPSDSHTICHLVYIQP